MKTTPAQRSAFQRNRTRGLRRAILTALSQAPAYRMNDEELHALAAELAYDLPREDLHAHLADLAAPEIAAVRIAEVVLGEALPFLSGGMEEQRVLRVQLTDRGMEFVRGTRRHESIALPGL